jgi:hypothetical protein
MCPRHLTVLFRFHRRSGYTMEARLHRDEYLPAIFLITEGCIVLGAPVRVRAVSADLTTLKSQTFLPNSKLSDEPLLRSWDTCPRCTQLNQDHSCSWSTPKAHRQVRCLCGKSTVISLLLHFYYAASGRITLNGEDISVQSPCYIVAT